MRRTLSYFCVFLTAIGVFYLPADLAQSPSLPELFVDAAANRHPINPDIYGIASYQLDPAFAKEVHIPNVRWGGDMTTRYNWLVDSSNSGFDWFFLGGNGQANPVPGASVDQMITTYGAAGAHALITVPIMPFINRSADLSCSFPVSAYGPQQRMDPSRLPDGDQCGNSISIFGVQIDDRDVYANHVDNSPALQQGWLQHLVSVFGTAANGGVPYYQLDNEPFGWSNTHRDVLPRGADYPTIVALAQEYAEMIKETDPSAKILGPSDFSGSGWIGDPRRQNNLYAGQYYLQRMAAYEEQHGQRILDYFDEHYYATSFDDASELASTRTLWDPSYIGPGRTVFNAPMQLIPRFKSWIQQYYPGTRLSISEYGFSTWRNPLVDALTQADVLGIFGREGLDFANMWTLPMPPPPVLCAFRLFRNYDGQGGQYGDTWVESSSSDQGRLSIYGAQRSSDRALTVLVINKTTQPISTTLSLANFAADTAQVFSYSGANLTQILPVDGVTITANRIDYDFPAYSATLFVIPDASPVRSTVTSLLASTVRIKEGQSAIFAANVSPASGSDMPTGVVDFVNDQTVLDTIPLINGQASFRTTELSAGLHSVTASYSGDVNYAGSTSAPLTISVAALPNYAMSLSDSLLHIGSGASATLGITVVPQNGFNRLITFGCTGLPAGAACTFTPPNITPYGTASMATTVSVSMPASTSVTPYSMPRRPILLGSLLLSLIAFGAVRRLTRANASRNPSFRPISAFTLASFCICLAGCAFQGSESSTVAARGARTTYIVTVTAGGKNVPSHSQQFILDVLP